MNTNGKRGRSSDDGDTLPLQYSRDNSGNRVAVRPIPSHYTPLIPSEPTTQPPPVATTTHSQSSLLQQTPTLLNPASQLSTLSDPPSLLSRQSDVSSSVLADVLSELVTVRQNQQNVLQVLKSLEARLDAEERAHNERTRSVYEHVNSLRAAVSATTTTATQLAGGSGERSSEVNTELRDRSRPNASPVVNSVISSVAPTPPSVVVNSSAPAPLPVSGAVFSTPAVPTSSSLSTVVAPTATDPTPLTQPQPTPTKRKRTRGKRRCSHVGCTKEYKSKEGLRGHEASLKGHREHVRACVDSCDACTRMFEEGWWCETFVDSHVDIGSLKELAVSLGFPAKKAKLSVVHVGGRRVVCLAQKAEVKCRHTGCLYTATNSQTGNRNKHERFIGPHADHIAECIDTCEMCQQVLDSGDWIDVELDEEEADDMGELAENVFVHIEGDRYIMYPEAGEGSKRLCRHEGCGYQCPPGQTGMITKHERNFSRHIEHIESLGPTIEACRVKCGVCDKYLRKKTWKVEEYEEVLLNRDEANEIPDTAPQAAGPAASAHVINIVGAPPPSATPVARIAPSVRIV